MDNALVISCITTPGWGDFFAGVITSAGLVAGLAGAGLVLWIKNAK